MTDGPHRIRPLRLTLFQRIILLILLGLTAAAGVQLIYTEAVLETAILDQVKRQAAVFLLGIERQIKSRDLTDREGLRQILLEAREHDADQLGFTIQSVYLFDVDGRILAHTTPGEHPPKSMGGRYGEVIRTGTPYLGARVEYAPEGEGPRVPKTDVIVPLHRGAEIAGGLEVELDLRRTLEQIKAIDDTYEGKFTLIVGATAVLVLLLFGWVLRRGLVGPLNTLGATTQQIAAGDLSARITHTGADEIGTLGQAVNTMADSIERLFNEQEQAYLGMLQSLAKALEAKDAYTASHSGRVARYSVMLGRRLGLPEDQLVQLKQGALVHDLGKIGIADAILNKPSALTPEEFEVMRAHPELTAAIMRPLKRFQAFVDIARSHHERWDGNGYPDGLAGDRIPLLARIVAIADTWDAMTGDRVYRQGMSVEKALSILQRERERGQWDPNLVGLFITMIREEQVARSEVMADMFGEAAS